MRHRERIELALNHETPDRCPMQISFTPEFAERLCQELSLDPSAQHNPHGGGNTYILERLLDEDMLLTSVGWANSYYQQPGDYIDEWGVGWKSSPYETPYGTGRYTEMVKHPLADDLAIVSYKPPDPGRGELYTDAERVVREFKDEYWLVGVTVTTIFECAWALRGYERLLGDFILNPDLADCILEFPYRYHLAAARRLVELGVDMIWLGDDIGTQKGLLISPAHWRKFLKPRLTNLISEIKSINPRLKVAYHTDGKVWEIIPELIEIGVDVLNPVQPACMDPALIKKKFAEHLCFWGSIDEQHTLPFGSPQQVKDEIMTRLGTLGKNGGLILGPTHHVQLDTPMENFWAMVNTITQTPYTT